MLIQVHSFKKQEIFKVMLKKPANKLFSAFSCFFQLFLVPLSPPTFRVWIDLLRHFFKALFSKSKIVFHLWRFWFQLLPQILIKHN